MNADQHEMGSMKDKGSLLQKLRREEFSLGFSLGFSLVRPGQQET